MTYKESQIYKGVVERMLGTSSLKERNFDTHLVSKTKGGHKYSVTLNRDNGVTFNDLNELSKLFSTIDIDVDGAEGDCPTCGGASVQVHIYDAVIS